MNGQPLPSPAAIVDFLSLAWILVCGFLVLFMQVGFTLVTVGFAKARHAGHAAMLNLLAFAVSSIAYYLVGFGIQYGGVAPTMAQTALSHLGMAELCREIGGSHWGIAGGRGYCLAHAHPGTLALFFFELMFLQTAVYIPVGAAMERIRIAGFMLLSTVLAAVVFPLYANWSWGGGFLSTLGQTLGLGHGFVDFAGSTVVHSTGGYAGLAIALVLGPRLGKFNREGNPIALPGHNLPLVVVGTLVLLFGWMGFNCGSTLSGTDLSLPRIAVNTVLAASIGCLTSLAYTWRRFGKPDVGIAASGLLAGTVAITAPCAFVAPWAGLLIGGIAGVLVCLSIEALEWKGKIDDPASVISIHGICGTWGALSVGLFADGQYGMDWNGIHGGVRGLFYGDPWQLAAQFVGCALNFVFVFLVMLFAARAVSRIVPLRPTGRQETDGLDLGECGAMAYPDFPSGALSTAGLRW